MRKSCTTAFLAIVQELRVTRPDGYQGLLLKLDLISKTKPALISFMGSFYSQELVYVYRGFPQDTVLYLPRSPVTVSKFYSEMAQLQKPPCHRGRGQQLKFPSKSRESDQFPSLEKLSQPSHDHSLFRSPIHSLIQQTFSEPLPGANHCARCWETRVPALTHA